jgi:hypothetical protein
VNPFLSLVGTAALLAAPLHPGDAAKRDRYQKMADALAWKEVAGQVPSPDPGFSIQSEAKVAESMGYVTKTLIVHVLHKGREVYRWNERGGQAFLFRGDTICRADYSGISSGCAVIAFDLKAGKELWKVNLKGLGPIDHSEYHNRVRMEKVDDTVFAVYGDESAGKYVELVEYATGRTLGHKVFPRE